MISRAFSLLRRMRLVLRSLVYRYYLRLAHPGVQCHPSVRFGRGISVRAFDGGRISIGAHTAILDHALIQADGGIINIGENCHIGRASILFSHRAITIGRGTLIGEYVTVRDQDHIHSEDRPLAHQGLVSAPIEIGDNVWLGAKVTVTRGVTIVSQAVVGANAVVTASLDRRGVYGGVPARLLKDHVKD